MKKMAISFIRRIIKSNKFYRSMEKERERYLLKIVQDICMSGRDRFLIELGDNDMEDILDLLKNDKSNDHQRVAFIVEFFLETQSITKESLFNRLLKLVNIRSISDCLSFYPNPNNKFLLPYVRRLLRGLGYEVGDDYVKGWINAEKTESCSIFGVFTTDYLRYLVTYIDQKSSLRYSYVTIPFLQVREMNVEDGNFNIRLKSSEKFKKVKEVWVWRKKC